MEQAKIDQLRLLQAEYSVELKTIECLDMLKNSKKGEVLQDYKVRESFRSTLANYCANTNRYDRDGDWRARFNAEFGKDHWAAIRIYPERYLGYENQITKITDDLVFVTRWGSHGVWDDDRYYVMLVGVPTKEDLPEVLAKIRKYCPDIKFTHQFTETREY